MSSLPVLGQKGRRESSSFGLIRVFYPQISQINTDGKNPEFIPVARTILSALRPKGARQILCR
jgi:hypothetical protein